MMSREAYMEIHALKRSGLSMRAIARTLGIHRATVKRHLSSTEWPSYRTTRRSSKLAPYYQQIQDWLDQNDYQATWIHDHLRQQGFDGSYQTVRRFVHREKARRTRVAYIRFETEPGGQGQMDWGEFQIQDAGRMYLFLLVLGYSRAIYAEFMRECTLESLMDGHIRAFRHLGGVPQEMLYDRMAQVVRSNRGETSFNVEFLDFARYYQFTPRACPAYSPWVKGKVERPIHYLRERFWRGYPFTSLEQANRDLWQWLKETANIRILNTPHEAVDVRWERERPMLAPLPDKDYDTSLKVFRKVGEDCLISYRGNRYVVPHRAVGQRVLLRIKEGQIRIYLDYDHLATYQESQERHQLVGLWLYEELRRELDQKRRKYGRAKGKATLSPTTRTLFPEVQRRPLSEYEWAAMGGVSWKP